MNFSNVLHNMKKVKTLFVNKTIRYLIGYHWCIIRVFFISVSIEYLIQGYCLRLRSLGFINFKMSRKLNIKSSIWLFSCIRLRTIHHIQHTGFDSAPGKHYSYVYIKFMHNFFLIWKQNKFFFLFCLQYNFFRVLHSPRQ